MHIKFIVNSFPNPSETFLFNLVTGLEAQGCKVTVCATSENNSIELYKDRLKEWSGDIEIIPLTVNAVQMAFKVLRLFLLDFKLAKECFAQFRIKKAMRNLLVAHYLKKGAPDIVHFAYSGIGVSFCDAASLLVNEGLQFFISCRGTAEKVKPLTDKTRAGQLKKLFCTVDKVHCVSYDMMEGLIKYGLKRENTFVNYPAINVERFQRDNAYLAEVKKEWSFLTTGRLHFQKGYIYCLHALKSLKEEGVCFKYNILGEGPDRNYLEYLIHELDLVDDVYIHGKVSSLKVKEYLNDADIFILPSLYEGVANAALEAMSMSVPVVATTAGGMAEVIENRVNGIIVDRFSSEELKSAILELVTDTKLRNTISNNSRKTIVENFNSEKQIAIFLEEYSKALQ